MPERLVTDLATVAVLRPDGTTVDLGSFWREQPVLLAIIRHFG